MLASAAQVIVVVPYSVVVTVSVTVLPPLVEVTVNESAHADRAPRIASATKMIVCDRFILASLVGLSCVRNEHGSAGFRDRHRLAPLSFASQRTGMRTKCFAQALFSNRVIATKITAPTNADLIEPIMPPPGQIPNIPKTQPPRMPPRMPRMMSTRAP